MSQLHCEEEKQDADVCSLQGLYGCTQAVQCDGALKRSVNPQHQALGENEIRLLTIHSEFSLSLETSSLKDALQYDAISYCWGEPKNLREIHINGRRVMLRNHVLEMLQILYQEHGVARVWLDIVCIDQKNGLEKSTQIPLMGKIFSMATRVFAWLGSPAADIDLVFDVLQEFRDHKRSLDVPADYDTAEQLSFYRELFADIFESKAGDIPTPSEEDDKMLHEEFNWLRPMYSRPYWSRVWIVQELILARSVIVCCGHKSISFNDIYGLSLDWGSFEQGFSAGNFTRSETQSPGWSTIQSICGHRRRLQNRQCDMTHGSRPRSTDMVDSVGNIAELNELVWVYARHHQCKDFKDKVYGFLELNETWKSNIVVDYNKSDLEVFLDVAKLDLFETRKYGSRGTALQLWKAMGLGDEQAFNTTFKSIPARKPPRCNKKVLGTLTERDHKCTV